MTQLKGKLLALHKTKHSMFCKDVLETGKGMNIAHNDYFLARQFIEQSYDEDEAFKARINLSNFINVLCDKKIKVLYFAFAFNKEKESYVFEYVVRSMIHKNPDFKVQGMLPNLEDVIFVVFPQMFATAFNEVFSNIPFDELEKVSKGQ